VEQLPNVSRSLKKEFATIADVSCKFTLNKLQHAAFRKIGSALLARWKKADDLNYEATVVQAVLRADQLRFYLGGEGGTGKTRVLLVLCRSYALAGDRGIVFLKPLSLGRRRR
jgi:RecA-family ATPase